MEMNYQGNDFERFLREKTDEFIMHPSKRVWYSIYNNMHPGNRLPSVSMSVVLLCLLFVTGYLNTRPAKNERLNTTPSTLMAAAPVSQNLPGPLMPLPASARPILRPASAESSHPAASMTALTASTATTDHRNRHRYTLRSRTRSTSLAGSQEEGLTASPTQSEAEVMAPAETLAIVSPDSKGRETNAGGAETGADHRQPVLAVLQPAEQPVPETAAGNLNPADEASAASNLAAATPETLSPVTAPGEQAAAEAEKTVTGGSTQLALNESDRSWIDHDVFFNRRTPRKWAGKLGWQAYLTPGIVYRSLSNNAADKLLSGNGNANFNNADVSRVVRHKPSVGVEAGLILQYDLLKKLKLKGGVQFNFTRYNALAFETSHPIATSITMNGNDPYSAYEVYRSTVYSNSVGLNQVKLHNQTFQFSLPIGADYRLARSGNLSWYAGATLQPTVVLFAQTYLISSDRRTYVKDGSMLNRINLNAGFETYLSFNKGDYSWQIGPQFRTQLFSTNNKIYSVEERLMNVGVKLGISRRF